jgi:hypothetical protein
VNGAEDTEKHFLREVEGFVAVAQQVDRQLDHHARVFGDELGAVGFVVRCTPLHKGGFANADVRPRRGAGLLQMEIPGNLLHYSQVRH